MVESEPVDNSKQFEKKELDLVPRNPFVIFDGVNNIKVEEIVNAMKVINGYVWVGLCRMAWAIKSKVNTLEEAVYVST